MIQIMIQAMTQAFRHKIWIRIYFLILIIFSAVTVAVTEELTRGNMKMMDNTSIEALLESSLLADGEDYLKLRDTLLSEAESNPSVLNIAKSSLSQNPDWRRQLLSKIITGWITNPSLFEQCTKFMQGDLSGIKPMGGFTLRHRAHSIANLGPDVVARILEKLWKSVEFNEGMEESSLYVALELLKDPQSEALMLEYSAKNQPEKKQILALTVLIQTDTDKYTPLVFDIAQDKNRADDVRIYAIKSLDELPDPQALPMLEKILQDEKRSHKEHLAAAEGIAAFSKPSTRALIVKTLQNSSDEDMLLILVGILTDIGIKDDIPHLKRAGRKHDTVNEYVEDAIEVINTRESEGT